MWRFILYNLSKIGGFPFDVEKNPRVQDMKIQVNKLGGLKFNISISKKGWVAECTNLKGIITGGENPAPSTEEIDSQIQDAIYTAFEIPPHLCNKDNLVRNAEQPAKNLVYVGK